MTAFEHTLLALCICIVTLAFLLSEWTKLDSQAHHPWQRHLYLLRPLDTVEWFMLGREEKDELSEWECEYIHQMTKFMDRILSKYEGEQK